MRNSLQYRVVLNHPTCVEFVQFLHECIVILLGFIVTEQSRYDAMGFNVTRLVISCSRSVPVQPCSLFTACHDMSLVAIFRQPLRKLG